MKLVFGLGNPEPRYEKTRHNIGFAMLGAWVEAKGGEFRNKPKFHADVAEISWQGEKVIAARPTTYYNNVGEAYQALCHFYGIKPEDTLIIADELALPFGTIRTRQGGSAAGNNGIKSIIAHGGEASNRIRIGVWNELVADRDTADFVLSAFSGDERETLPKLEVRVLHTIDAFCDDAFEATTHQAV